MNPTKSTVFFFLLVSVSFNVFSQTTAQWRGINRDGIYNETQLLKSWSESGPDLIWSVETIGNGYGSPVITDENIFVNGEIDTISHVFAFDTKGQLVWKTPNGKEYTGSSNKYVGSRSTPTVAGDLVYACSGNGRITCLEVQSGKEKWTLEMSEKFDGMMNYWGYAESLLIDNDKLYCFPGGTNINVAALNRFTGDIIWTSKALGDTVSYCSPMIIKLPSVNLLVNLTSFYIMGLDANTGELLWSQPQNNVTYKQQCNTPLYSDDFIYYVAGDGNGAVKLKLSPDGKNITEIWSNAAIKNNFNGFVKMGGYLFSTDRSKKLKCIDANKGTVTDSLQIVKGSLIAADSMLYCYSDNGEISLINLTGTKMEITGKMKCNLGSNEHFAHPVINNGVIYIRHGKALMAYNIKEK
ncbi:MAG: PQQ-binding-like beta-propeller repeat protein [Salinivirgaceae bacterium]